LRQNLDVEGLKSDDQLYAALARVGMHESLDHKIEEKGKNLSLGERQLICMARCLLQNAPLIIMDEATSAVDPQSEEIMVKATEEFFADRTQLIIAHRLSTLRKCDRILWLVEGQVHRLGPASKILAEFEKEEYQDSNV
jgi:ABC-type multidrug transport system fused ATPase/permease subunit